MDWTDIPVNFDAETQLLCEIASELLEMYFECNEGTGNSAITELLSQHPTLFTEDFIHHEGAWRLAAIAWHLICDGGSADGFGDWLIHFDRRDPDNYAIGYINNRYQGHWKPGGEIY